MNLILYLVIGVGCMILLAIFLELLDQSNINSWESVWLSMAALLFSGLVFTLVGYVVVKAIELVINNGCETNHLK